MQPLNEMYDGEISPAMSMEAAITGEGMSVVSHDADRYRRHSENWNT